MVTSGGLRLVTLDMGADQRPRLDRLDHLRAVAALLVLIWHGASMPDEKPHLLSALAQEGHTGVSLFCVISGFILSYLYSGTSLVYGEFIRRRVLRIVPLLALYTALAYFTTGESISELLTQIVLSVKFGQPLQSITGQDWSVFVELQFYLIFPFVMLFAQSYGKRYVVSLIGLAILLRFATYLGQGDAQSAGYWTIFGRIDQFLWGVLGGLAVREGAITRLSGRWTAYAVFGTGVVGIMAWAYTYRLTGGFLGPTDPYTARQAAWILMPTLEAVPYIVLIIGYLSLPVIRLPRILAEVSDGFSFLGRISYSLYLNQFIIMRALSSFPLLMVAPSWSGKVMLAIFITLPVLTIFSVFTYYLIEVPFMNLKARPKLVTAEVRIAVG